VLALDVDNDGDLDFLVVRGAEVRLRVTGPDGWSDLESAWPELPGPPSDALVVDHDHEGDLDLLFVGAFGARLWRNDGHAGPVTDDGAAPGGEAQGPPDAEPRAAFVDVTEEAGLPTSGALEWCIAEDLDTDQDVDFLVGGAEGARLFDSRRGGVFAEASDGLPAGAMPEPVVADLDGDAWPDLWVPGGDGTATVYTRRPSGAYAKEATGVGPAGADYTNLRGVDVDLDGALDAVWDAADGTHAALLLRTGGTAATLSGTGGASASADLDGDGAFDLALSAGDGARILRGVPAGDRRSFRLALHAPERDNRRGVGAVVEIRAGTLYRRIFWTGQPRTIGLGDRDTVDIVRVTWPRGVEQHDLDVAAGARWCIERVQRIEGSCPFLYTWNGETYEFVFDVLGATPLGLPMAPGRLVPFNHHEYSKIEGQKLVPDEDGRLRIALTEELREVTYLDRAQLIAVDHPAGVEVQPNEAFRLPPFPEHHLHTLRNVVPVPRVLFRQGRGAEAHGPGQDVTALTAALDRCEARPWTPLPSQFPGIAEPWSLELVLAETDEQRAALAAAPKLRLVLTGWLQWAEASTNMALAHHPVHRFELPSLSVPDADAPGGWRLVEPPIGFPAGKTRTQVVDVTGLVDPSDPRLLFTTTQRLSWDRIALALDADDAPVVRTPLEPVASRVTFRGFSRRLFETQCVGPAPDAVGAPAEATALKADLVATAQERFDWDELDMPRWNQHPGRYTRYGEVTPLLTTTDDMYVIFGAGDAVFVEFDGRALPPLQQGWTRDWLLYLDGWAKDRDPNTLAAETVEPLPFHGMSSYPPPPGESYPDTPAHRAYREVWNTRPGRTLIVPLAARR
jgi:hypothetical protein